MYDVPRREVHESVAHLSNEARSQSFWKATESLYDIEQRSILDVFEHDVDGRWRWLIVIDVAHNVLVLEMHHHVDLALIHVQSFEISTYRDIQSIK